MLPKVFLQRGVSEPGAAATASEVLAVFGGVLWALGLLGRRYSLEGAATGSNKRLWSAFSALVFTMGTTVLPAIQLATSKGVPAAAQDPGWLSRLPVVMAAGVASGAGGVLGTYALSRAGRSSSSALVTIVQNGVSTVAAPLLITVEFGEAATFKRWLGIASVCLGVPLMDPGFASMQSRARDRGGDKEANYGSATAPKSAWQASSSCVALAVIAGLLWSVASVARRYGVRGSPPSLLTIQATMTHVAIASCSCMPPAVSLACDDVGTIIAALRDAAFRRRMLVFLASAILSGVGGWLITLGLAVTGPNGGAAVMTIANGVYTVAGAIFIALVYQERAEPLQWLGVALIVAGVMAAA